MDVRCVICDELYPHVYPDTLEICATCYDKNFAGAQPSLDPTEHVPAGPEARAGLDAFLDSQHQMTPRQVQAMARLQAEWRRQAQEDTP